jgi:RNA polymerase sigma factor (sigma-70 family)
MATTFAPSPEPAVAEAREPAALVQDLAQKEAALLALFTDRRYALVGMCRKIGVREDRIDDLLQETWLHAHAKLEQLRDARAMSGWVRMILLNKSKNLVSRQREFASDLPADGEAKVDFWGLAPIEDDPLEILLAQERADIARAGIAVLSDLDRRSLDAFYLRELSLKEMAAEEGRPVGTMKRRVHDGRKRLRAVVPDDLFEEA